MNITPKHRLQLTILTLLLVLCLPPTASSQQGVNLVFEGGFNDQAFPKMEVTVTVINESGIPYQSLQPTDFQITEDGQPVKMNGVQEKVNSDVKISVVLAIDGSGSMTANNFKPWNDAKASAITFLEGLRPNDEAALVVFGDTVNITEPVGEHIDPVKEANFTTDKQALIGQIQNLPAPVANVTTTPLYDAAYKSVLIAASLKGAAGKRAVILFTDGKDEGGSSQLGQDAAIYEAQNQHIPIFSIKLGDVPDADYLQRLAYRSGGAYLEAIEAASLAQIYQDISNRLKTQYLLNFTSNMRCDNENHNLQIKVQTKDGETTNTKAFSAPCPIIPGIQLFYEKSAEAVGDPPTLELLPDSFELPTTEKYKLFNIVPVISARYPIRRVEYVVDDTAEPFIVRNAPYSYLWDTGTVRKGQHTIRISVYDNQMPPNVGVITATLTTTREYKPDTIFEPWFLAVLGVLLIVLLVGIALYRRYRHSDEPLEPTVQPGGIYPGDPGPVVVPGPGGTFSPNPPTGGGIYPGTPGPVVVTGLGNVPSALPPSRPSYAGGTPPVPGTMGIGNPQKGDAFLVIEEGDRRGQQWPLTEEVTIGRDGQCTIVLSDTAVSRYHARIKREGGNSFYIYNLGSTNEVLVNNHKESRIRLEDGDKIEIGRVKLVFKQVK
jgi:VWFA-related protein